MQVNRASAGSHGIVPLSNGTGTDICFRETAEVLCNIFTISIVHNVLAKYTLTVAVYAVKLCKVSELRITHLCTGTVSCRNTIATSVTPHRSDTVVLASGTKNDRFSFKYIKSSVNNTVSNCTCNFSISGQ